MLSLLVLLVACLTLTSAIVFSPVQEELLNNFIRDVRECSQIPSLTVGVVKNKESWTAGFGLGDRERNIKVNSGTTLFGIGSVSKSFTTMLLAMLIEDSQGRYNWESKVTDILADVKFDDEERTKQTTLKDILVHRTGLNSASLGIVTGWFVNNTISISELTRYLQFLPEMWSFRDRFEYNNWMYILAGHVIEELSGMSWETSLQRRILDPLGMTSTKVFGYNLNTTMDGVAQPYFVIKNEVIKSDPRLYKITPEEPAGGIASTADDVVKWIQFLLNKGKTVNGRQLLKETSLNEIFTPYQEVPPDVVPPLNKPTFPVATEQRGYGYGWFVANYNGYRNIWHDGQLRAYSSVVTILPDVNTGIFIGQTGPQLSRIIAFYISDLLLGNDPWLNASTTCTFPAPWEPVEGAIGNNDVINKPVANTQQYTGTYGHRFVGDLTIKQTNNDDTLGMEFALFSANLLKTEDENVFNMESLGLFYYLCHKGNATIFFPMEFTEKQNGKFMTLKIPFPSPLTFRRGVSFSDPFPVKKEPRSPPCTNNGRRRLNNHILLYVCVMTFIFFSV